jgi:hypothetical protein
MLSSSVNPSTALRPLNGKGFWILQVSGWLFLIYLIIGQAIPAFSYDLGVRMGTQDSAEIVTEVGVAFWRGFAFADAAIYIPLLFIGLIGHYRQNTWGRIALAAALGISVYWPLICLAAVFYAQGAPGWSLEFAGAYAIILPLISIWGLWGLWQVKRELT